jgi:hypothetical protein
MAKITEKQLIESLKQMKEIKPRKEWASLLRSQILAEKKVEVAEQPAQFSGFKNAFSAMFFQKRMAYSLAALLILMAGVFGALKLLPVGETSQKDIASLTGQSALLKQNVEALNNKISNLSASNSSKLAINDIDKNVSDLAKTLKSTSVKDPQTLKEIVSSLKTLADISGDKTDLASDPNVQDLYQTVVQSQIADLQKTTLTSDQKNILSEAQDLYNKGDYSGALEKIWDLSNNSSNVTNSSSLINTTSPTN